MTIEQVLSKQILLALGKLCKASGLKIVPVHTQQTSAFVGLSSKAIRGVTTLQRLPVYLELPYGYSLEDADFKRLLLTGPLGVKYQLLCAVLVIHSEDSSTFVFDVKVELNTHILSVRQIG